MRYFLYARKSTDVEDKQVLSIEAQLAELRALAKRDGLEIVEEFVEKRSAKMPGRPVFEEMLKRIECGDAQGVVCWKIDRLSRNPVDSGRISWLLQQGTIQKIITHDKAYFPHDNVLLMSVEFGMANQYIRDLSVNVTRGLRQKARQGVYPSIAPLGYLNDPYTKTIVVDRRKAPLVRKAFELYAKNESRLEDIAQFLFERGIKTGATRGWNKGGGESQKDQITFLLSNFFSAISPIAANVRTPLPTVSKELFDRVQKILALRSRAHHKAVNEPRIAALRCGECGFSITAEEKLAAKERQRPPLHLLSLYEKESRRSLLATVCAGRALDSQLHARKIRLAVALGERIRRNGRARGGCQTTAASFRDAGKDCRLGRQITPHRPLCRARY